MVLELETLIPEEVLIKLQNNPDFDLKLIMKNIIKSGIARQTVFCFAEHDKNIRFGWNNSTPIYPAL